MKTLGTLRMLDLYSASGCLLCDELSGNQPLSARLGIYSSARDKILLESECFILIRDICPLISGHSLLIPKRHYSNFGQLSETEREDFVAFKQDCVSFIADRFMPPILFEHGSKVGQISSGACISHAHIHFIPVHAPVSEWMSEVGDTTHLATVFPSEVLSGCAGGDYLACECQSGDGHVVREISSPLPCQFIRRRLAQHCDLRYWNWELVLCQPTGYDVSARQTPAQTRSLYDFDLIK